MCFVVLLYCIILRLNLKKLFNVMGVWLLAFNTNVDFAVNLQNMCLSFMWQTTGLACVYLNLGLGTTS